MQGEYKQFDAAMFAEQDARTRAAVLHYVNGTGLYCTQNPDLYGPDLIVYKGYRPISYIEVECKKVWRAPTSTNPKDRRAGQDFPWTSVQLPERKGKFLRKRLPVEFWILREDLQMAVIIPDHVITSSMLMEIPNRLLSSGELFYSVPLEQCILKDLSSSLD